MLILHHRLLIFLRWDLPRFPQAASNSYSSNPRASGSSAATTMCMNHYAWLSNNCLKCWTGMNTFLLLHKIYPWHLVDCRFSPIFIIFIIPLKHIFSEELWFKAFYTCKFTLRVLIHMNFIMIGKG